LLLVTWPVHGYPGIEIGIAGVIKAPRTAALAVCVQCTKYTTRSNDGT